MKCPAKVSHTLQAFVFTIFCWVNTLYAGGPLFVHGTDNQTPVIYDNGGAVTFNFDLGNLGMLSNPQADTQVLLSFDTWNNVATATVSLTKGSDLPIDVTGTNIVAPGSPAQRLFANFQDGLNPIIYDTDGRVIDEILGEGQSDMIIGFAGSAFFENTARFIEGQAVISGKLNLSTAAVRTLIVHEIGHFIGLDHAQLDANQGLPQADFPIMYPTASRSSAEPHIDDIISISTLYPASNFSSQFGELSGFFQQVDGTAIQGANIWLKRQETSEVMSIVSDFLTTSTGFFRIFVPEGNYSVHAESIQVRFDEGSSVGPFADDDQGISFHPPHPITPVQLQADNSPLLIAIKAACKTQITFKLNGQGSINSNEGCGNGIITPPKRVKGDWDGDGKADLAIWRPTNGRWFIRNSGDDSLTNIRFGTQSTDVPVPGDYDGDGQLDLAIWRPTDGKWRIRQSASNFAVRTESFGTWSDDIPLSGDFDGDKKDDLIIRRPSAGFWFVRNSSDQSLTRLFFGSLNNDVPTLADYDGDNTADLAFWRPDSGFWFIRQKQNILLSEQINPGITIPDNSLVGIESSIEISGVNQNVSKNFSVDVNISHNFIGYLEIILISPQNTQVVLKQSGSGNNDNDVIGNYPNTLSPVNDLSLIEGEPLLGRWRLRVIDDDIFTVGTLNSWGINDQVVAEQKSLRKDFFGSQADDVPAPGDYDGDGLSDLAIWRKSNGYWIIRHSSDQNMFKKRFGTLPGDIPVPLDYDGDGKTDIAIRRPSTGQFIILRSSDGQVERHSFGTQATDVPVYAVESLKRTLTGIGKDN